MSLDVLMLGDFDIKRCGESLIKKNKRAHKNLEMLAYLMTNRDKKLSPDNIMNAIWDDSNHADPQNALRTQIFRLRKLLREAGVSGDEVREGQDLEISFENGFYVFTLGAECRIDAELFEETLKAGDLVKDTDANEAIGHYRKAVGLYHGEYLEGNINSEWVVVIRARYHRLYIRSVLRLFQLLKQKGCWKDIVELFERVVIFEPLEEALHLYYLEALLNFGEYKTALSHYNYLTGRIYREFAVKPSPALKSVYRRIIAGEKDAVQTDIYSLRHNFLLDEEQNGALFCDLEYFKIIYNLEERRSLRGSSNALLGLITLEASPSAVSGERLDAVSECLKSILSGSLRRGDVFTQWNQRQIIMLLLNACDMDLNLIYQRIGEKFCAGNENKGVRLSFSFEPIARKQIFSIQE